MRPVLLPAQDILRQTILDPDLLHRAAIVPVLFAKIRFRHRG